ncbi:AAA family ATPase [Laceyella putida]|uniref:AAA family ATPase n=1 Tax=Laceyella putida TaxID=110101 RepID=A0ABW2RQW8_9BACL
MSVLAKGKYLVLEEGSREQLKARIVVCGPGGTGKTRDALRIAYGLTGDWKKIAILDTEYNRAKMHYGVNDPEVGLIGPKIPHMGLTPPYQWEKFMDALDICERAGIQCLILDSFTHEWEGEGGISDMAANPKKKGMSDFHAWRMPKKYHSKVLERILHSPLHIICTVRAKTEYAYKEDGVDDKGKTKYKVEKIGVRPQQSNDYDYLFDFVFMLRQDHTFEALKDTPGLFKDYDGTITMEVVNKIKTWLIDGEEVESYTDVKNQIVAFLQDVAKIYPKLDSHIKQIELQKEEEISLWSYQEVMDFHRQLMENKNLLSAIVIEYGKKNTTYADVIKGYTESKNKPFKTLTQEELSHVLTLLHQAQQEEQEQQEGQAHE